MNRRTLPLVLMVSLLLTAAHPVSACSTFQLVRGDTLLVGHNLDDYIPAPGLIVVNSRGIAKRGLGWGGFINPLGTAKPRLSWISRYGSVTYNAFGREFPDGGMNEAGLFVGEMSYWFTEYPKDKGLVRLYHHHWIQYLLDNFSSVGQVLGELTRVVPDGHCRWQFFVSDSSGAAATITFVKGRAVVNSGDSLPVKVLCNRRYAREMDSLRNYQGFGGSRAVNFRDTTDDHRFIWAAAMLREQDHKVAAPEYAFRILKQLDWGNNKWSLVYNAKKPSLSFNTSLSRQVKTLDFRSLDFSSGAQAMVFDINTDVSGDVSGHLMPFSEAVQREYVGRMWDGIDLGFFGNLMFKPLMKRRMVGYIGYVN